jgi:reductive dehalogenase
LEEKGNLVQTKIQDAVKLTEDIKDHALSFGADMVGVSEVNPAYVFEGSEVPHKYAISLLMEMEYDKIKTAPSLESRIETLRVYYVLGEVTMRLAAYIRSLGYPAIAHLPRSYPFNPALLHVPFAVAAGLGEFGRIGLLVTERFGPRLRLGTVTTDMPIEVDKPVTRGIPDFCETCGICAYTCPGKAISSEKHVVRGVNKYVIDTKKCHSEMERIKPKTCLICVRVCPYSRLQEVPASKGK